MSTVARLALEDYDRMVEAGVFGRNGRRRIEFILGEIREMTPIGWRHEEVVDKLLRWTTDNLGEDQVRLRVQNSIGLPALQSAPEPDVAWLKPGGFGRGRPEGEDVLLIIEVAETSLEFDTGEKADLYASAGIADYWVVDLAAGAVEVRRQPLEGRYRSLQTFSGDADVRPLAFPEVALRPSMLWETSS